MKCLDYFFSVIKEKLATSPVVALDIEGYKLGKSGLVSLLQIALTPDHVICFDVLQIGCDTLLHDERSFLRQLFEDGGVIKLCYDSRCDADYLWYQHGIRVKGMYDVQVVYTRLFQSPGDPYLKGLHVALSVPGIVEAEYLDSILKTKQTCKRRMRLGGANFFMVRPLDLSLLQYCAIDVIYLFSMFRKWGTLVSMDSVVEATKMRIQAFLDNQERESLVLSKVDFPV